MSHIRRFDVSSIIASCLMIVIPVTVSAQQHEPFRPPAVPLITHDPYFSVWATNERLTVDWCRHWTGAVHPLWGMVQIDGKTYRFLGPQPEERSARAQVGIRDSIPDMTQLSLQVFPTRTVYEFEMSGLRLRFTFTTPLLPHDLNVLSRPVTYLTWDAQAVDNNSHTVSIYFDASALLAVNTADQQVTWSRHKMGDLAVMRLGSRDQPVLGKSGDDLRIDWGYLYLAIPPQGSIDSVIASNRAARESFARTGVLPEADDLRTPRAASDGWPVMAATFNLGKVSVAPVSRHLLLAYDDLFSIEYLQRRLRPYWRRDGMEIDTLLRTAARDYASLTQVCQEFDEALMADLKKAGGELYSRLAALAYRQCIAAHKLVADFDGTPLFFSKENFSNGCIDTVDVTYPSSPFFLLFNPRLLKAQLVPTLEYARSSRWRFPFAPHDLGTYPLANGQVYGGGERTEENQMPVEESGNMLLMIAGVAKVEGNTDFALKYWPLLAKWARYLRDKGLDPQNQLCTDDFAGHLAHNTNLSLKAILALGSYAMLCQMTGKKDEATDYRNTAQGMASKWAEMADDGDHYRLAFDKPGTWSQKYNLIWDRLLGLNLFPPVVARKEISYYMTKQNAFGLPLDNRETYAKLDWVVWAATLAESRPEFEALITPIYRFANETPNRVPLTDWYWTVDGKQRGFQARSVVGGIFVKMLTEPAMWERWSEKAREERGGRAN